MEITHFKLSLDDEKTWQELELQLANGGHQPVTKKIVEQLKGLGATSIVVESEYFDRDFSEAYSAFYSTIFRRHPKACRRFHFFSADLTALFQHSEAPAILATRMQEAAPAYLGYLVQRPLRHAPIGVAVLKLPYALDHLEPHLLVRSTYKTHLLGAEFTVVGIPFTQQDSRVGACAQATIWMAGRHFHTKHAGPWISTVGITEAATEVSQIALNLSLPAGSEFLTLDNMATALRAMGRQVRFYQGVWSDEQKCFDWGNIRPYDEINRYVDSGIPVILGLAQAPTGIGHAMLATGHVLKTLDVSQGLPQRPTRAEFCESFLVNDDQRGPNLQFPIKDGIAGDIDDFSFAKHLAYLIVPLPSKVYLPGEAAEKLAWDLLSNYRKDWDALKKSHQKELEGSIELAENFCNSMDCGVVVARTYLTYGWKHKHRMLRNRLDDNFKALLLTHDLPKYVWVTEFGTLDSLNTPNPTDRKIFAHTVVDATASQYWDSWNMLYAPGFGMAFAHSASVPFAPFERRAVLIPNASSYFPKIRGEMDFARFGYTI